MRRWPATVARRSRRSFQVVLCRIYQAVEHAHIVPCTGMRRTVQRSHPIWVEVSGRRMFLVGFPPPGVPYGIFEPEMVARPDDLDMSARNHLTHPTPPR